MEPTLDIPTSSPQLQLPTNKKETSPMLKPKLQIITTTDSDSSDKNASADTKPTASSEDTISIRDRNMSANSVNSMFEHNPLTES